MVANVGMSGSGDADTIGVIDLKLEPPRVVNSYTVGQTPEGMKMSPDGKFVAVTVMNGTNKPPSSPFYNDNGMLQVWARNGTQLTKTGELPIGKWCQGVAWSANGKTLLVQCMVEEEIIVVRFSGLTGKSLQKVGHHQDQGRTRGHPHRGAVSWRRGAAAGLTCPANARAGAGGSGLPGRGCRVGPPGAAPRVRFRCSRAQCRACRGARDPLLTKCLQAYKARRQPSCGRPTDETRQ